MYREVHGNMSLEELLFNMTKENALDTIKVLKVVFGISHTRIADIMGISKSTISMAVRFGTFDSLVSDSRLEGAIVSLRAFYLDRFFMD